MRGFAKAAVAGLSLLVVSAGPLAAQTSDEKLKTLLQELDALIKKGETQNLADPWYLQDLRALSQRYGQTWPVVILDHNFDSRSSQPKAPWEVRRGEMRMDWSRGLRSRVEVSSSTAAKSDEEVAKEIIGGILSQALGGQQSQSADPSEPALALASLTVSNAFQMTAEISGRDLAGVEKGGLELGVFQSGNAGYRLVLAPRDKGGATATLLAVSSRGTTRVIDSANAKVSLTNDQPVKVVLARRPGGMMSVAVGEQELFAASDQSFRDAFSGLLIANKGGDYAVKRMTVRGTN